MWRPVAAPGCVWPGAEPRQGAIRRRGRVAALRCARSRRHGRGGGTAGPRDSSGAWRLQLARRRPERRKATEVVLTLSICPMCIGARAPFMLAVVRFINPPLVGSFVHSCKYEE
ncbi:hypothetical protein NDU88_005129 [Pleurodeles waltl]|uniref:Uncharacterized protein n=1 Tax=Pleurodeles waltl TaxID=8319 RepID=A0AAV7QK48_PLEWA|nr:hypothetical protein NDU88_005129 [Pleurodeles waltl]